MRSNNFFTSGKNPISAIRSASSITAIVTSSSRNAPCRSKSCKRPGHATRISTPFARSCFWRFILTPPYTDEILLPPSFAIGRSSVHICSANSLVGARTSEVGFFECAFVLREITGIPNAKVLPDPVGALPQRSRPAIASGIVAS